MVNDMEIRTRYLFCRLYIHNMIKYISIVDADDRTQRVNEAELKCAASSHTIAILSAYMKKKLDRAFH